MNQYAVCVDDLSEMQRRLDLDDDGFDSIAPVTQHLELQDENESNQDLHPDLKGEVRVHNNLGSNQILYFAYLVYKVSRPHIKRKSINKASKLLKFACCAAAIIYIGAKPRSYSGFSW